MQVATLLVAADVLLLGTYMNARVCICMQSIFTQLVADASFSLWDTYMYACARVCMCDVCVCVCVFVFMQKIQTQQVAAVLVLAERIYLHTQQHEITFCY
jgi:hypothetical protein